MKVIIFEGWKVGMRKIPFIKLLNKECKLSLKEAKHIKDCIVDNKTMVIEVEDAIAEFILKESRELGVICRIG